MKPDLPVFVKKYFWGDDLSELAWPKHRKYIIQTLLEKGNKKAISWLFSVLEKHELRQMLPSLKLSKKSLNFWKIYLA